MHRKLSSPICHSYCVCPYPNYKKTGIGISQVIRIQSNTGELIDFPDYLREYSPTIDAWMDFKSAQGTPESKMIYKSELTTEQLNLLRSFVLLIHTDRENFSIDDQAFGDLLTPLDNSMLASFYHIANFFQFGILTDILSYEIARRVFSNLTIREASHIEFQLTEILKAQGFTTIPEQLILPIQEHLLTMIKHYTNNPQNLQIAQHKILPSIYHGITIIGNGNIVCSIGDHNGPGRLRIINPNTFESIDTDPAIPHNIRALAYEPRKNTLFATTTNAVYELDPTTFNVIQSFMLNLEPHTYPWDMAINQEGQILVLINKEVLIYTTTGALLGKFGKENIDITGRLCLNSEGKIFVLDRYDHTVRVFSPKYQFLYKFKTRIGGSVTSIAIDSLDRVIVAGVGSPLKFFNANGSFIFELPLPINRAPYNLYAYNIEHIAIDNSGNIICLGYMGGDEGGNSILSISYILPSRIQSHFRCCHPAQY